MQVRSPAYAPASSSSRCALCIVAGLEPNRLLLIALRALHRRRAKVVSVAHLLGAEAVHLEYPTQVVFKSMTVGVSDGDRIGVVGRNGDGKSSLLDLLTGQVRPDSGRVTRRSGLRTGAMSQADTLDSEPHGGMDAGRRPARARVGR